MKINPNLSFIFLNITEEAPTHILFVFLICNSVQSQAYN